MRFSLAATVVAILVVAGCTSSGSTGPADEAEAVPVAEFVEVEAPAELDGWSTHAVSGTLIGATESLPGLLVSRTVEPDGRSTLSVSAMTADGDLKALDLGVDIEGDVLSRSAAGSEDLTVIGGSKWLEGQIRPFILTSSDRNTWSEVTIPATLDGSKLTKVTVDSGIVFAGITNVDSTAGVAVVDSGDVTVSSLPSTSEEKVTLSGIAANVNDVVITGSVAAGGEKSKEVAWISVDGGTSFSDPVELTDDRASITGVVRVSNYWVITGTQPNKDDEWRPVTWESLDGTDWKPTTHSWGAHENEDWRLWRDNENAILSAPLVTSDGTAHIWASTAAGWGGALYTRNAAGAWWTEDSHVAFSGSDVGAGASLADVGGGNIAVLRSSNSWMELSLITPSGWQEVATLSEREDPKYVVGIGNSADGVVMNLGQSTFTVDGDRWSQSTVSTRLVASAAGVTADPLPSPLTSGDVVTDPASGTEVLFGSTEDEVTYRLFEGSDGAEVKEIDADVSNIFGSFFETHVSGTGFVVAGRERPDFDVGSGANQVTFLTSADAKTWERASAEKLGNTSARGSSVSSICALADVGALAVGTSGGSPTTWIFADGDWSSQAVDGLGDNASLTGCVSTADSVVVLVQDNGYNELWQTTDGIDFKKITTIPNHVSINGFFAEADSTLLVGGQVNTAEYTGPALLLSQDAATWRWLPIPANGIRQPAMGVHDEIAHIIHFNDAGIQFFKLEDIPAAWDRAKPLA